MQLATLPPPTLPMNPRLLIYLVVPPCVLLASSSFRLLRVEPEIVFHADEFIELLIEMVPSAEATLCRGWWTPLPILSSACLLAYLAKSVLTKLPYTLAKFLTLLPKLRVV